MNGLGWTVLVPIKNLDRAKSRLRGTLAGVTHAGVTHERLVLAMAMDTIAAATTCPAVRRVVAVTSDPRVVGHAHALGAETITDAPARGLNSALSYAETIVRTTGPRRPAPLAALTADLPALRSNQLAVALGLATTRPGWRRFVPDALGTGTVLLAVGPSAPLEPRFGPRSAAAHSGGGALPLVGEWPGLRQDVDTAEDLAAARRLGLGWRTAAVVDGWSWRKMESMQATVARFDERHHNGVVLLDDGSELEFTPAAFARSGLRLLRVGQRVHIDCDDNGEVTRVTIAGLAGLE